MAKNEKTHRKLLRHLPPIEEVVRHLKGKAGAEITAEVRTRVARRVVEGLRSEIEEGLWEPSSREEARARIFEEAAAAAERLTAAHPRTLLNATGVLLHTNLGRAPLGEAALRAVAGAAGSYSDLEFDLQAGSRGSRLGRVEELLCALTGAASATAVNNNAGAVLLALDTLASGREVVVSRGHLVEIGGSFRMPDIMAKSGAKMVEVGTTNRTHLKDYEGAVTASTALILHVHQSNFLQKGFVRQVPLADLVALGSRLEVPVLDDQGSGVLSDPAAIGAGGEPTVMESLEAGVAVVTASGDKLLGGPQAGIILGRRAFIARMRANPLARALRLDKLQLAALEATLQVYLTGSEDEEVPLRRMARLTLKELEARARGIAREIEERLEKGSGSRSAPYRKEDAGPPLKVRVIRSEEALGGGSSPDSELRGWSVALEPTAGTSITASRLDRALRNGEPPLLARVSEEQVILTVRSLLPAQDRKVASLVARAVKSASKREST